MSDAIDSFESCGMSSFSVADCGQIKNCGMSSFVVGRVVKSCGMSSFSVADCRQFNSCGMSSFSVAISGRSRVVACLVFPVEEL